MFLEPCCQCREVRDSDQMHVTDNIVVASAVTRFISPISMTTRLLRQTKLFIGLPTYLRELRKSSVSESLLTISFCCVSKTCKCILLSVHSLWQVGLSYHYYHYPTISRSDNGISAMIVFTRQFISNFSGHLPTLFKQS